MRTTKAVSISLPPAELRQAQRLARQTNRSLSGLVREGLKRLQHEGRALGRLASEYTTQQRHAIDASIKQGMDDIEAGRLHGPFASAEETSRYIERVAKGRKAARKTRRAIR